MESSEGGNRRIQNLRALVGQPFNTRKRRNLFVRTFFFSSLQLSSSALARKKNAEQYAPDDFFSTRPGPASALVTVPPPAHHKSQSGSSYHCCIKCWTDALELFSGKTLAPILAIFIIEFMCFLSLCVLLAGLLLVAAMVCFSEFRSDPLLLGA